MSINVAIVPTGAANLASVQAALRRAGCSSHFATTPAAVEAASHLVLPGVGAFGPAMERLRAEGLVEPLRARVQADRPTLAVCLGHQLLFERSEEAPGATGLGLFPGGAERFPEALRVPQLGWNRVRPSEGAQLIEDGQAYFANSFRITTPPPGFEVGWAHHGEPFVGTMARGRLLTAQFHPELSGAYGAALIERWLKGAPTPAPGPMPAAWQDRLRPRLIPCLDVKDGRVVKGIRFQGLRDAGDPVQLSAAYEAQGADELVILDVSATPEGRGHGLEVVEAVRAQLSIPLTVGGGVRAVEDAGRFLDAGADKVGVNTAAVNRPEILAELAERFGRQCVVLALDAARREGAPGWQVVTRSGRDRRPVDAIEWAARGTALGAGEILLTSWDRDGTGSGYDLDLLSQLRPHVHVPVIASGGAATAAHLAEALEAGADAVLAATIFHDGHKTCAGVKKELAALGQQLR